MTFPRLGLLSITAALYLWQQDHSVQVSPATATAPNVDPHADGGAPEALRRLFPTAFRPAAFHEQERDAAVASGDSYFEGWYFKSEADTGEVLALIPGIMHSRDSPSSSSENVNGSHAFVIVFDGARASKTDFPLDQFSFTGENDDGGGAQQFDVRIGESRFWHGGVELAIPGVARGSLRFRGTTPWPVSLSSPGIMGVFAWLGVLGLMECSHGVPSLSHSVHGSVRLGGRLSRGADGGGVRTAEGKSTEWRELRFSGSRGYVEKDRGTRFPKQWVWMQTNHFRWSEAQGALFEKNTAGGGGGAANSGEPVISLTASMARIPLPMVWRAIPSLDLSFPGFIVGLLVKGRLYRFATYSGAVTTHFSVSSLNGADADGMPAPTPVLVWKMSDARHTLHIEVLDRGESSPDLLWAPMDGRTMSPFVVERLNAVLRVRLTRKSLWPSWASAFYTEPVVLFDGTGRHAGLELMVPSAEVLRPQHWRRLFPFATPLDHPVGGALLMAGAALLLLPQSLRGKIACTPSPAKVKGN